MVFKVELYSVNMTTKKHDVLPLVVLFTFLKAQRRAVSSFMFILTVRRRAISSFMFFFDGTTSCRQGCRS